MQCGDWSRKGWEHPGRGVTLQGNLEDSSIPSPPRVEKVGRSFFSADLPHFLPWSARIQCLRMRPLNEALSLPFPALAESNWHYNKARRTWTLVIPRVHYYCFLETNNSLFQEALRGCWVWGAGPSHTFFFCYLPIPQAARPRLVATGQVPSQMSTILLVKRH